MDYNNIFQELINLTLKKDNEGIDRLSKKYGHSVIKSLQPVIAEAIENKTIDLVSSGELKKVNCF